MRMSMYLSTKKSLPYRRTEFCYTQTMMSGTYPNLKDKTISFLNLIIVKELFVQIFHLPRSFSEYCNQNFTEALVQLLLTIYTPIDK